MKSCADEIAKSMHDQFISKTVRAKNIEREEEALNRIANAGILLDNIGMKSQAQAVNAFLLKLGDDDV
jgi:hypothetical protein